MHFWLRKTEDLRDLEELFLADGAVRFYKNFEVSLTEAIRSLTQVFPHKKAYAFIRGTYPEVASLSVGLSKEGFLGQEWNLNQIENVEFKKDLLFAVIPEDDPLTGEIFEIEKLCEKLEEKKIFSIRISSHLFKHKRLKLAPNSCRICFLGGGFSMTLLGQRFKLENFLLAPAVWSHNDVSQVRSLLKPETVQEELVRHFESKEFDGSKPLLAPGTSRIFDRAAIFWNDLDSSAIRDLIIEDPQWKVRAHLIESTSPCRWTEPRQLEWLHLRGYSPDQVRGCLVVHHSLLTPEFEDVLKKSCLEIRRLQNLEK